MIIALPTADRRTSYDFYRAAFGFTAFGDPADDGVPEPLQFRVTGDVTLMLIPTVGFGWVVGDRAVADRGTSECVLSLPVPDVDAAVARAVAAGAQVVAEPVDRPWGYTATVSDPDGHVWQLIN